MRGCHLTWLCIKKKTLCASVSYDLASARHQAAREEEQHTNEDQSDTCAHTQAAAGGTGRAALLRRFVGEGSWEKVSIASSSYAGRIHVLLVCVTHTHTHTHTHGIREWCCPVYLDLKTSSPTIYMLLSYTCCSPPLPHLPVACTPKNQELSAAYAAGHLD